MRIISGSCRGRKLITPKNWDIRPTSDRVRESLFNILGPHELQEARVLDLFAGTGALGLESLSRGAEFAYFVDLADESCRLIKQNISLCKMENKSAVIAWDLSRSTFPPFISDKRFDMIFMDPPYGKGLLEKCLRNENLLNCLDPNGTIIIEHTPKERVPKALKKVTLFDQRRYGKTVISFLETV